MRSLLFVPGDSQKKLEKAQGCGADALILDLEDSVALSAKPQAREIVRDFIENSKKSGLKSQLIVRLNALDSGLADADLDGVMQAAPAFVMLPKARGGADVSHLAAKLAVREAEFGLPDGGTKIIAIATETADAIFGLGTYAGCSHRLAGLTWGAEDLSADLGSERNRDVSGVFTEPFRLARNMMLFAASASAVPAIDTVYVDFRNEVGLRAECEEARRDGFTAKMAIHPAQVAIINEIFTPSPEAVAQARRIVEAFAANPGLGVVGMDGAMVDQPHLRRAQRILERVGLARPDPG